MLWCHRKPFLGFAQANPAIYMAENNSPEHISEATAANQQDIIPHPGIAVETDEKEKKPT